MKLFNKKGWIFGARALGFDKNPETPGRKLKRPRNSKFPGVPEGGGGAQFHSSKPLLRPPPGRPFAHHFIRGGRGAESSHGAPTPPPLSTSPPLPYTPRCTAPTPPGTVASGSGRPRTCRVVCFPNGFDPGDFGKCKSSATLPWVCWGGNVGGTTTNPNHTQPVLHFTRNWLVPVHKCANKSFFF